MLAGVREQGELQHRADDPTDTQDPQGEGSGHDPGDSVWGHDPSQFAAADTGADFEMSGGQTWYATCESGHAFWADPDRPSYEAAEADARAHDHDHHNGEETAVVLS